MNRDLSADLTSRMLTVAHETISGVDCCGCIIAVVEGGNVELRCNERGAAAGIVQIDILRGLLGVDGATATCPHCGHETVFLGFDKVTAYVCDGCGRAVDLKRRRVQGPVEDGEMKPGLDQTGPEHPVHVLSVGRSVSRWDDHH